MQVSVQITGEKELMAKLDKLALGLTNFTSAFKQLGISLVDFYSDNVFASQGGALSGAKGISGGQGEGVPWARLAPSTVRAKNKHWGAYKNSTVGTTGATILRATGTMQKSFYYKSTRQSLEIGNTAPYFDFHQGDGDRTRLPRRPMLGVNNTVKGIIQQVFEADIRKKIGSM